MDRAEIKERVIALLKTYTRNKEVWETASEDSSILSDLKVNSARIVDVVIDLEDEFEIDIQDSSIDFIVTIGDMIRAVEKQLEA